MPVQCPHLSSPHPCRHRPGNHLPSYSPSHHLPIRSPLMRVTSPFLQTSSPRQQPIPSAFFPKMKTECHATPRNSTTIPCGVRKAPVRIEAFGSYRRCTDATSLSGFLSEPVCCTILKFQAAALCQTAAALRLKKW